MNKSILILMTVLLSGGFSGRLWAGYYDAPASSYQVAPVKNPSIGADIAVNQPNLCSCFQRGRWNLDVLGGYTSASDDALEGPGGGVQVSTFYNEIFGWGGRAYWWDGGFSTQHDYSLSAFARYPIPGTCVAPYIYVGGGVRADGNTHGTGHIGAGIDVRFASFEGVGIFVDYRHTWSGSGSGDYGSLNGGLRFSY